MVSEKERLCRKAKLERKSLQMESGNEKLERPGWKGEDYIWKVEKKS